MPGTAYGRGRGQPPQRWRLIVESYPCDTCGAGPGAPCLTISGTVKHEPHVERVALVVHCIYCLGWLAADWPELVCDVCLP
jgi:hypothetical protein